MQPLKWVDESDADVKHTAQSALHNYTIQNSEVGKKYEVKYESHRGVKYSPEPATGFATIDDAKTWCWNHYNEKMQPYVKPLPTWIDASERLPEKHTTVLVVYHAYFDDEPITEFDVCTAFFDGETFDPKDQLFYQKRNTMVVRWMPIPEFSTMQNLHKGE